MSLILFVHICSGTIGVLSGFVAMALRNGARWHAIVGSIFVVSMLGLGLSGVYMAIVKNQPGNILGGTLTCYLVATAWMSARHSEGKARMFNWGALLAALAIGGFAVTYGVEAANSATGMKHGYPPGPYFFLGSIGLLAAVGDARLLLRGGISGAKRIARHLWRMCFALFIGAASVFLARQHLFPVFLRKTGALYFLSLLPIMVMIFWMLRVLWTKKGRSRFGRPAWPGLTAGLSKG